MKKRRRPRPKIAKAKPKEVQTSEPPPPPKNSPWKSLFSFAPLASLSVIAGLVLAGDWVHDQYVKATPAVVPKEVSGAIQPPPFIIKNISPYFKMEEIELICGIDSAMFLTADGKSVGFSMPITSGRKNGPLGPGGDSAEFKCDPSAFMKVENGELSLMGLQTKSFNSAGGDLKLAGATVWIGIKRKTLGIQLESISPTWELKRNGDIFSWQEARPNFK